MKEGKARPDDARTLIGATGNVFVAGAAVDFALDRSGIGLVSVMTMWAFALPDRWLMVAVPVSAAIGVLIQRDLELYSKSESYRGMDVYLPPTVYRIRRDTGVIQPATLPSGASALRHNTPEYGA